MELDIGSDLYGTKHNTKLRFAATPALEELTAATESFFDTKSRSCRPAGYPDVPFKVETFQLFDDAALRWVDLVETSQLRTGQQLWCFQPESIWHSDAQGVIPQAEQAPVTWTVPEKSPRRRRMTADAGVPPTLSEKLRSVFYQCDPDRKGYLVNADLQLAFRRCEMEFTSGTADQLFTLADANTSGHITYDEWVSFAIQCPQVVDALFFRLRDLGQPTGQFDLQHQSVPHAPPPPQQQQQPAGDQWAEREALEQLALAKQQDAQRAAQEAQRMQAAAERAAAELAAAQEAARQAAEQQAALQRAAEQAAQEHERAAADAQRVMQQPESLPRHVAPPPGAVSPQREQALREYEAAKERADALRAQKEDAERAEREAWTRLYRSPTGQ
eukprot:TRINITY_DN826_c4_g1_i1.p1 TRINITY_DN826_c4_g1~~TRINITY_DN826_c4_g1_i1.p1  ORF type:complete len:429 (+),score=156.51 TRINITY_DN826_c4_g1_i1:128-1288(+)